LGLERSLGYAAGTNSIWDLEESGCILVFNSNLTEEQNVVGVPIKKAAKKDTALVVIDPREVELTRYARLWLRPVPGTELLLLGAILRSLIDQGLEQTQWLEENCESPATLRYALHSLDIEQVSQVTHVSQEEIAEAARLYGQAQAGAIVYALDNIPEEVQQDCVRALVNLALLTGNLGQLGSGLYPMRQGANEQGAWDVGCLPDRLPGYGRVSDDAARQALESAWSCSLPSAPGLGVAGALRGAKEGRIRAMLVLGDSPGLENSKLGDSLAALEALDFLVVHDTFLSPVAQRASVVLPRVTFAEKDGTYTNLERRIQRLKPALSLDQSTGNEGSQAESWVICQLADRMNTPGFHYLSASQTMDEIAGLVPMYAGVSYERLESAGGLVLRTTLESPQPTQVLYSSREYRGIQWPCHSLDSNGTPDLYAEGFPTAKAEVETPQFRAAETPKDAEYPAWFVPGRVLLQHDRETEVVKGKRNQIVQEALMDINPDDAAAWQIEEGDEVEVSGPDLQMTGRARLIESVPVGVIAATSLFGQLAVDLQASEEMDPAARLPGLEILPAKVVKLSV
jgi:predicted molibdopterin-dependent oxidoreductase YjgC